MPHNPYTPPAAPLENGAVARPPAGVVLACRLIGASFLVGLVALLPGVRLPSPADADVPLFFTLAIVGLFGGITLWLMFQISSRKNWARWAMLGYLALGWSIGATQFSEDFMQSPLLGFIDVACIVAEGAACTLLFFGTAAAWFKSGPPAPD